MSESLRRLILLAKERGTSKEELEQIKQGIMNIAKAMAVDTDQLTDAIYTSFESGCYQPVVDLRTSPLRLIRDE